ncbi:hypothetical protein T484DRAFT_1813030 [Baffinella frigidus]|nr:hypothetical protein T484DRAFT_1813030 [Cryptophyta sp. CCMP2293]
MASSAAFSGFGGEAFGGGGGAAASDDGRNAAREQIVQQLVAMSFPEDTARIAVEASGGLSVDAALSVLFGDSDNDSMPELEDAKDTLKGGAIAGGWGSASFGAAPVGGGGLGGGDALMGGENPTEDETRQLYGLEDAVATMQRAGEDANATLEEQLFSVEGARHLLLSLGFSPEGAELLSLGFEPLGAAAQHPPDESSGAAHAWT